MPRCYRTFTTTFRKSGESDGLVFHLYLHCRSHTDQKLYWRSGGNGEIRAVSSPELSRLYDVGGVPAHPVPSRPRPLP
jgi:hypothetical protein